MVRAPHLNLEPGRGFKSSSDHFGGEPSISSLSVLSTINNIAFFSFLFFILTFFADEQQITHAGVTTRERESERGKS